MKKNKLSYLGFLGLLGLLGLPTGNYGFFGFFGAFAFFGFLNVKNDEMLRQHIAKAGLNAFIVSFVGVALTIAVLSILQTLQAAALFIAAVFLAQLWTFIISYYVYEKRGDD
jgi:hypothetical protein